jgi:uncharacterized RDD family membrane protein YckC
MTEQANAAVGKDPRGVMTPQGLFVLSTFESGTALNLISGSTATALPLVPEFLETEQKGAGCRCCTRMVWHQGKLYLFWQPDKNVAWSSWDGTAWSAVAPTGFPGGYDVLSDGSRLYLFHRTGEGKERQLTAYLLEGNSTTVLAALPVTGTSEWDARQVQGKVKLFTQQFMTQTFYTLENGQLVDPVTIKSDFFAPAAMLRFGGVMAAVMNALLFGMVFAASAIMNRYKRRTVEQEGKVYEFASLFRRFAAHLIDTIVLLVPPVVVVMFFIPFHQFPENPLAVVLGMLFAMMFLVVGTYLYYSLLEGLYGRTLGKKLCGIRVLKEDLTPCTLSAGFLRNLLRIVDLFFYYLPAAIAMAATMKWQRIGDVVAETVVVRER